MTLIRTNFGVVIGANTGLLGGTIFGWLSPVASALLHNDTTIGLLLNALKGVGLDDDPTVAEAAPPARLGYRPTPVMMGGDALDPLGLSDDTLT
ncbi:MAG TPA: hypothetical protein DDY14_05680 [Chromatiaceae bacterium]|jgi:hypothetical protein|nr:MAG: hypothetical protein N838_08940 [Thiohalocapsa sp. PB-PSB1]QQO57178.1 MAG: hypothetical protein N838_31365 [Thiohalocapsa sp. PB-PSB1]HBG94809.1 hypothetical protein [Chromatiaceae bacterium]HCS89873.1 hypothetical protein [Chromatiaceae bacterium]